MKHLLNFEQLMESYNSDINRVVFFKDQQTHKEEPEKEETTEENKNEAPVKPKPDIDLKLQCQNE